MAENIQACSVIARLSQIYPDCKINFDLEDCDRILRVESTQDISKQIIALLTADGFVCEILL